MKRACFTFGLLIALGCTDRAARRAGPPGPYPPPREMPPPRLDPPPQTRLEPQTDTGFVPRVPTAEAEADRQEREQRAQEAGQRLELFAQGEAYACAGLTAKERVSCPLQAYGQVERVEDVPRGVRLIYKSGSVSAPRLRELIGCQAALARVRPQDPPFCPFFNARTEKRVRERQGRVVVDLLETEERLANALRQQVRLAFRNTPIP